MKISAILGIIVSLFATISSVQAKEFNTRCIEIFASSTAAIMGASDDNSSPEEPDSLYFGHRRKLRFLDGLVKNGHVLWKKYHRI